MILTHGANSIPREHDYIEIAGGIYKYVKIGNLLWTTRNFSERIPGVEVIYPNGNSANEEKYGLLYKAYDMFNKIIPILPTGWRVPNKNDFNALSENGTKMWKSLIAEDEGGDNEYGFNARLNGYRNSSGSYSRFGDIVALWTSYPSGNLSTVTAEGRIDNYIDNFDFANGNATSQSNTAEAIRFCKDAS